MPIGAIVGALAAVGDTISNVVDRDKRRKYEQNLAYLSISERKALNKTLQEQSSEEARQKILADTLGNLNRSRINAMVQVQSEKEKTKRYTLLLVLGGVIVLSGIVLLVVKNKRK